ncbi:MAG: T9SS type A sorting domain-containing protein, partial [Chitinophagales bacterium]|nr:T9SS type A sorting domain-containing protein [Chitinophagales bacterium]
KMPGDLSSDSSVILGKPASTSDHPSYNIIQPFSGTFGTCRNSDPYVCIGISHTLNFCLGSKHDYWVTKTNNNLTDNSTFANCPNDADEGAVYGGTQGDDGFSIAQGCDAYIMAGFTKSGNVGNNVSCNNDPTSPYKEDAWIAKIDSGTGGFIWNESLGDTSNDGAYYLARVYDASFIMVGYTSAPAVPSSKGYDFFIVKFEDTTATCSKPTGLSRTVQTTNCRVIFSWTSLPCVPSYILKYKTFSGSTWTTVDPAPNPDTVSFAGGNYVWTVQAKCSQHKSSDTTRGAGFQFPGSCHRIGNEAEQKNSLLVYPNPSDGSFEISFSLNSFSGPAKVEILDLVGQVVSSSREMIEGGLLQRKIFSPFPSGCYWVRVIVNDQAFITRLILQRD